MNITAEKFLNDEEYKDKNVWDFKYISTSDDEDNDSSGEENSEEDKDEEKN